jgi:hypothetical protein
MATACSGNPAKQASLLGTFPSMGSTRLAAAILSSEGNGSYLISGDGHMLTVAAADTAIGANHREVLWPASGPAVADSQACATWVASTSDDNQQGLAFRIISRPEWTRAITVTKNVEYGVFWEFNVHTWDSADTLGEPFTQVAQFDMQSVLEEGGTIHPYPWRVCARVQGHSLDFKLWFPDSMKEPPWSSRLYARHTDGLPDSFAQPGRTGWYAGHIAAGNSVTYADLRTWSITAGSG